MESNHYIALTIKPKSVLNVSIEWEVSNLLKDYLLKFPAVLISVELVPVVLYFSTCSGYNHSV